MPENNQEIIQFPCRFPIKAMGLNAPDFASHVEKLVSTHVDTDAAAVEVRIQASKAARFISVTVVLTATSRAQLDAIYQALTDDERVVMAL